MKNALLIAALLVSGYASAAVIELKPIEGVQIKPIESVGVGTQPKGLPTQSEINVQGKSCSLDKVAGIAQRFADNGVPYGQAEANLKAGVIPMQQDCDTQAADMNVDAAEQNLNNIAECALKQNVMAMNVQGRLDVYTNCAVSVMGTDVATAAASMKQVVNKCHSLY